MSHEQARRRPIFITGLIILFPLIATVAVLAVLWGIVGRVGGPAGQLLTYVATKVFNLQNPPQWMGTLAALILVLLVVYGVGLLAVSRLGTRVMGRVDALLARLPVVRYIYPHAKTLADFLFGSQKMSFNRVVAIEYPRKGVYAIGFITNEGIDELIDHSGKSLVTVFIPTSPTPFTGWTALFEAGEVLPLNMTVDEAVRFIVSCGVITPGSNGVAPPPEAISAVHQTQGSDLS